MDELSLERERLALLQITVKAYDPNQPREPKGHPDAGKWRDTGASSADEFKHTPFMAAFGGENELADQVTAALYDESDDIKKKFKGNWGTANGFAKVVGFMSMQDVADFITRGVDKQYVYNIAEHVASARNNGPKSLHPLLTMLSQIPPKGK